MHIPLLTVSSYELFERPSYMSIIAVCCKIIPSYSSPKLLRLINICINTWLIFAVAFSWTTVYCVWWLWLRSSLVGWVVLQVCFVGWIELGPLATGLGWVGSQKMDPRPCLIQRQITRKWYKTALYLQRPTNRKSHGLSNGAIFNDLERSLTWFKVTPFFDTEYLTNGYRYGHSYYRRRMGNRTLSFAWHHFQWHWLISNPDFKVTILFDVK